MTASVWKPNYLVMLGLHVGLAGLLFLFRPLSLVFSVLLFVSGLFYLVKTRNQNNEVLVLSAYFVGIEVLLRMTKGMPNHEFCKYSIILFMLIGMYYKGAVRGSYIYTFFLLLLVPGIYIATQELSLEADVRKAIAFNISGPVCLGICAIYCFNRRISFERMKDVISAFCYPLIGVVTYIYLYNPSVKDVVTGTYSNSATSGGFGPNQVSTMLGLGMFVFFVQFILNSKNKLLLMLNGFLVLVCTYRGLITFSRGGVYTGLCMIVVLAALLYFYFNIKGKLKIISIIGLTVMATLSVWLYSSFQTGGLIEKRYANEDALGRKKENTLSGREILMETELKMFTENPILGIGVGRNKEYREAETGIESASHNEITRMLAEHGSFGVLGLMLLIFTPIILYLNNWQHIFMFSFFIFWALTINHAAMRLAAPAFVYALCLLKLYIPPPHEENSLRR
jgi:hypothetical protein